jgi:hypothetical protein
MPEPDLSRLGSGRIRLDADVVRFLPSRAQAWRGIRPASITYAEVASLVMTEPKGLSRGRLVVRLGSGDAHVMSFRSGRLPRMRRIYRDVWARAQAARGESSGGASGPDA